MSKELKFKTDEEFIAAREKFFESHPEAPKAEEIDCLNLIMRKEFAEQIIAGTKKLEFRNFSEFYVNRLIDKKVNEYINQHIDDDEVVVFCNDIRQVQKIHFHNYNNSWFLDVECTFNDAFSVIPSDIEFLQNQYGVHDFDELLKMYEEAGEKQRPFFFYFVCGKVVDTNLVVKPKEDEYVEICGGKIIMDPICDEMVKGDEDTNILKFKVSKNTFKDIVSGHMGVFTKEITPKNLSMFFITEEKGTVKEINGIPQLRSYDAIQFTNKEDSYTCQINNADVVLMDEENGNLIPYSELEDDIDYTDCMIAYDLGDKM